MIPILPLCDPRVMLVPVNPSMIGNVPVMTPMAGSSLPCPVNNLDMSLTTSLTSKYDSHIYGRFRHVAREDPGYRHAPFDWYRPPKQYYNIVHEDAAVVTHDGPVPIGDFYRYYIYGDEVGDNDDNSPSSLGSDEDDNVRQSSYEARTAGYQRSARTSPDLDNEDTESSLPRNRLSNNYTTLAPNRRTGIPPPTTRSSIYRGNRTLTGDDEFDDAASVNSTFAN